MEGGFPSKLEPDSMLIDGAGQAEAFVGAAAVGAEGKEVLGFA